MKESMEKPYTQITYERLGFESDMVLDVAAEPEEFEMKLLYQYCEEHEESGLLSVRADEGQVRYAVQGFQRLCDCLSEYTSNFLWIWQLLKLILDVLKGLEDWLLLPDSVVLEPQTIYVGLYQQAEEQPTNLTVRLCYVPNYSGSIQEQLKSLLEHFMQQINHKQDNLVVLVYGMYHLIQEENYSLFRVERLMTERYQAYIKEGEDLDANPADEGSTPILEMSDDTPSNGDECAVAKPEFFQQQIESLEENVQERISNYERRQKQSNLRQGMIVCGMIIACSLLGLLYAGQSIASAGSNLGREWLYGSMAGCLIGVVGMIVLVRCLQKNKV
jgi:hypothetical protein